MPRKDPEAFREYNRAYWKQWYANPENKAAHNARAVKRNAKNKEARRQYIRQQKDVPCTDCNQRYPYYVMQFDHVRGEKKFDLSQAATMWASMDRIIEEVAKCEVVCANCHAIRSWSRVNTGL